MRNSKFVNGVRKTDITVDMLVTATGYSKTYCVRKLADCKNGLGSWDEIFEKKPDSGSVNKNRSILFRGQRRTARFFMDSTGHSYKTICAKMDLVKVGQLDPEEMMRKISATHVPTRVRVGDRYYNAKKLSARCKVGTEEAMERIATYFAAESTIEEMLRVKGKNDVNEHSSKDQFGKDPIEFSDEPERYENMPKTEKVKRDKARERKLYSIPGPTEAEKRLFKC